MSPPSVSTEVTTKTGTRVAHEGESVTEAATVRDHGEDGSLTATLYGPFDEQPGPDSCVDETTAGDAVA